MPEKIKTRKIQRNIKSLNRTVTTADSFRKKNSTGIEEQNGTENPVNYAEKNIISAGNGMIGESAYQVKKGAVYARSKIKTKIAEKNAVFGKDSTEFADAIARERRALQQKVQKRKEFANSISEQGEKLSQKAGRMDVSNLTDKESLPAPKSKSIIRSVKEKQRTVKTAGFTQKTTIKTGESTVRTSKQAAQKAIKDAKKSAQVARKAQRDVRQTAKMTAKAVKNAVRSIIMATKTTVTAIIAGGWVAILIILLVLMIGLVANSAFGIFFSNDDNAGSGQSMSAVVAEINKEYQTKIDTIKKENPHDMLEMSGARATWEDVLSVYAVKTNTNQNHPQEVATIDTEKKELLRTIFWKMNVITHHTEKKKEKIKEDSDDGKGNIKQKNKEVTRTYLYIKVTHKNTEEMSKEYGFDKNQKEQLAELLAEKNDNLWAAVLNGTSHSIGDGDIVKVAKSQIGNVGGEPYWRWYGFNSRVSWCACFVSWCANQCGYIQSGVIPRFSLCTDGVSWFQRHHQWQGRNYAPAPGDIIFFDWNGDGKANHVGIVEKEKNGTVYTIEGNTSNSCKQHTYSVGSGKILGYGVPEY